MSADALAAKSLDAIAVANTAFLKFFILFPLRGEYTYSLIDSGSC